MKFLCDNCKAKYQIADEKVAGKTVRMKCRKCGHQIEVRAAVTETSVSTSPPVVGEGPARPMAPKSGLATSLSAAKPRAPAAGVAPQTQNLGGLAGAFQRTVQDGPQTVPVGPQPNNPVELSVTDEWYVAINGVPVGPVRISELRRKAASGAVTEESLCWQEGLEEWRPVRSIPELAAIVREAAQGNRPSLIAPAPNEGRGSSPPRAPQRATGAPAPRPNAPSPSQPSYDAPRPLQPARSNVVPLRVAASATLDDMPPNTAPLGGAAAAALAPTYPQPAFSPQIANTPAPVAVADPFAVPPLAATPAPLSPLAVSNSGTAALAPMAGSYAPSLVPAAPKRGVPLWFWPILLFTGVFGAAAAFFVFKQGQQPPAPVVIQMPPTATVPTATEPKNDVPPPSSAEPAAAASVPSAKVAAGGPKATAGTAPAATPKAGGGIDLGGLGPVAGGPNVGGGGPSPGAGGGGLDSSSVQRVVSSHQSGVKRTCWERGGGDSKSSVNVTVSAQVGPAGNVIGTSSSGDDPVVAKCIEGQVKTWMFSAPGSTTTVNIPFKFVRQ